MVETSSLFVMYECKRGIATRSKGWGSESSLLRGGWGSSWIYRGGPRGYSGPHIEVEEKKTPLEVRLANYSHLGNSSSADPTTQRLRR